MDREKVQQLDFKVDSIFRKLSQKDAGAWQSAKHNSDRIEIVFRNADLFHRELSVMDDRSLEGRGVWKSDHEAEELRRQGNEEFAKGRYLKAIERYSAAIVRAPVHHHQVTSSRPCPVSQLFAEDHAEKGQVRPSGDGGSDNADIHEHGSKEGSFNSKDGSKEGSFNSKDGSKEGSFNSKDGSKEGSINSRNGSKEASFNSKDGSKEGSANSDSYAKESSSASRTGTKENESCSRNCSKEDSSNSRTSSKELALAFANRSAALFHLKRCEEAIRDIDWSLRFGYPRETRYKLYERRARACLQLCRRQEAYRDASEACIHLRETMSDGAVRRKHLSGLDALRNKCREEAGVTLEEGERHEVGEKRKVGKMDQQEEQQNGPEMRDQMKEGNGIERDSRKEDDGSKRFKERDENHSKENTRTKSKRIENGCWNQTDGSQERFGSLWSSGARPGSGLVADRVLPELHVESFFAGIDVCRSELCGRYTVSKQDFRVGDVIARTSSFAAVLFSDCHSTHCYHCFREVLLPFPCFGCSQVVYCDDGCSSSAWNAYHWAECGWMGRMGFDLVGKLGHLAYRMLVTAGLENVRKTFLVSLKKNVEKIGTMENNGNSGVGDCCKASREVEPSPGNGETEDGGRSEAMKVSGASYEEPNYDQCSGSGESCRSAANYPGMMSELVRHESSRIPSDDLGFCVIAFALLQTSKLTGWLSYETGLRIQAMDRNNSSQNGLDLATENGLDLATENGFYLATENGMDLATDNELDLATEKAVFTALLHHIQTIQCNGFEIAEMRRIEGGQVGGNVLQRHRIRGLGIGLYPDLAIINHSCDPTVDLVFNGNLATIRAIRNITASEELTVDYGQLFFINDKSKRQSFLRSTYFFDCRCLPCLENWPLWEDLPAAEPAIKCFGCGTRLKAVSVKGCPKCRRVFGDELMKAVTRLDDTHRRYTEAMRGMDSVVKDPEVEESELREGVTSAEDYLSAMQELLCPPWKEFYSCQATLRQCYRIMANVSSQSASG